MKALFAIAVAAFLASANAQGTIQEEHPIDWYDCSGKPDGNYDHPSDCTRFISCSGGIASQRDCAACNIEPHGCPTGRLVYNSTRDSCLWAYETECRTGGVQPPPTDSTQPPPTNSTQPPPTVDPVEGGPCNPEECRNVGYCQSYLRCDKDSGKWVREECGLNLVWNPINPNGTEQIHGGNCDNWGSLSDEVERKYRTDPDCLACFWRSLGDCSSDYEYQQAGGTHRNVLTLSCGGGLVFSQEKTTCQLCSDVRRADNSTCC